jgi:hypothetical protein
MRFFEPFRASFHSSFRNSKREPDSRSPALMI